jgi:predicted ArsR family transcriptional regulator
LQAERASDHEGDPMLVYRCPFREIAEARPDVVCSVHLGLMRGALSG